MSDDVYNDDNSNVDVRIDTAIGGNYENIDKSSTLRTVLSDDSDTTTITLIADTSTVNEGGTITYSASVNHAPETTPLAEPITSMFLQ